MALDVRPPGLVEATAPGGAGVVDEQMQPAAVLALDHVTHVRGRVGIGQIDGDDGAPDRRQLRGERPQLLLPARDEHELRARFPGESPGGRLADAGRGPGDDGDVGHRRQG